MTQRHASARSSTDHRAATEADNPPSPEGIALVHDPDVDDGALNLKQVARLLDVHYMTVYRYVRHGRLRARRVGPVWMVDPADVDALLAEGSATRPSPGEPTPRPRASGERESTTPRRSNTGGAAGASPPTRRTRVDWAKRLSVRLVAGDEVGAWTVLRDALHAGHDVASIHLEVVAAAIATVSREVGAGTETTASERVAVATASRVLARLGAQFPHRGRKRGTLVLAAPPGEHHGVPLLLVANLIRHAGYRVVELGTDTPAADVVAALDAHPTSMAVGLGVTTIDRLDSAREVVDAARAAHPDVPVLLGGQAVRNPEIAALAGATAWSAGPDLIDQLEALRRAARRRTSSATK